MTKFQKGYEFKINGKEEEEWEEEGRVIAKTDKAVLFLPHSMSDGAECWFPKSQLIDFDDDAELEEIESLVMSLWIAKKKGLTEK